MPKTYMHSGFSADEETHVSYSVMKTDDGVTLTFYGSNCSGNTSVRLTSQAWSEVIGSLQAKLDRAETEKVAVESEPVRGEDG
jgi:hypothetical protein